MLEGMIDMEAFVVRTIMAVPVIVADVLRLVNFPVCVAFDFRLGLGIVAMRRGWRHVSLVRARRFRVRRFGTLRPGYRHNKEQRRYKDHLSLHDFPLKT
jgi:hypothetical protein